MNWDRIQVSWEALKGKIVFQWFRAADDSNNGLELIGVEMSGGSKSDVQLTAFHPGDREKRSGFSLHIGS
jgi:hypothetical protein